MHAPIAEIDLFGNVVSTLAKKQIEESRRSEIPVPEQERQFIPHVTINPNYIVFWDHCTGAVNYHREGLQNNDHDGEMSRKASKRVREILSWFSELAKEKKQLVNKVEINYRLTFATLTLPSPQQFEKGHTDEYIKRNLLNRFLQEAKRRWKVVNYLWRAEAQENGNIHFHITFDRFVWHADLRQTWNSVLADYGYIQAYSDRMQQYYRDGFRMSDNIRDTRTEEKQRESYERGKANNWTDPNSTDIHSIHKVRNVGGYLAKYVSKNLKIYQLECDAKAWKLRKLLKAQDSSREVFISAEDVQGKVRLKFSGTPQYEVLNMLEQLNIKIKNITEVVIRAITGRLWFCSRTLKQLKNITLELTNDIFNGVQELIRSVQPTERPVMVKNKWTGEMMQNRYVKVLIGNFLSIKRETPKDQAPVTHFSFLSHIKNEFITPLLQTITDRLKGFWNTITEELQPVAITPK